MPTVPFSKTGTAPEDTTWDWSAATQHKILGTDGDNWKDFKAAHAWFDNTDGSTPEKEVPYKLPHHRMGESGLEAVWHGVSNAVARLNQADIPESEMKSVFDHLTKHYAQWDKTPPEWDRFLKKAQSRKRHHSPLPMGQTRALVMANRVKGQPTASDLELINNLARSPLSESDIYVIPARISDDQVDAYFTRMSSITLQNYASDASCGVSLCDSHSHYQMPIGRTFFGETATQGNVQAALSLAYMLRGMSLPGDMSSDDYIRGIEGGIYQDVSVGFDPSAYWCSVCDLNMLDDFDCNHWPGRTYDTKNGDVLCIAEVDAHLVEESIVYEGANYGATILPNGSGDNGRAFGNILLLKADAEVERGRATARDLTFVEDHTHTRLFQRYHGITLPQTATKDTQKTMTTKKTTAPNARASGKKEFSQDNLDRLQAIHTEHTRGHRIAKAATDTLRSFITEKGGSLDESARAGKEVSQDNMDRLQDLASMMSNNHMQMEESLRAMADFITEKGGVTADPDDDGDIDDGPDGSTDDTDGDADGMGNGVDDGKGQSGLNGVGSSNGGRSRHTPNTQPRLTDDERAAIAFAAQVKQETIEQALHNGVRALGTAFNEDRYRAILQRSSYEEIREMARDWESIAANALSPKGVWDEQQKRWTTEPTQRGGRQTAPRDPSDPVGINASSQSTAGKLARQLGISTDANLYKTTH